MQGLRNIFYISSSHFFFQIKSKVYLTFDFSVFMKFLEEHTLFAQSSFSTKQQNCFLIASESLSHTNSLVYWNDICFTSPLEIDP